MGRPRGEPRRSPASSPTASRAVRCGCGDAVCAKDESPETCEVDCGVTRCGHGKCDSTESALGCPGDCDAPPYTALGRGGEHACALASGTLSCWGNNNYGQLGDGTITVRAILRR